MTDVSYIGSEPMEHDPQDGYMAPRKYRITASCDRCGNQFHWVTTKLDGKDRPCPKKACREAIVEEEIERRAYNLAKMLDERRPPGHIGDKVVVKAVDATAEIVMTDYGMTDLKDSIRHGEAVAQKLPPAQQAKADNYWSGKPYKENSRQAAQMNGMVRRALGGAYRSTAVNPVAIIGGKPGETPLRSVGTEQLQRK